jgi:hypothetical protein
MNWEEFTQKSGVISANGDCTNINDGSWLSVPKQTKETQVIPDNYKLVLPQNGRVINVNQRHDEIDNNAVRKQFENPFMTNNKNSGFNGALGNITAKTKLSEMFFSRENIDIVQTLLRYEVYKMSGGKYIIGRQSDIDLEVEMRAIYLQFTKGLEYNYNEQIKELNQLVVEHVAPSLYTQVKQYEGYIYDTENLPVPISRPDNVSNKGTRQLGSWLN